ncbi:MAG: DUF3108 domain-containing protein [Gemmatimonadaceae bacterium]|jgi:hypothetical protein|nr:DUF3108 domain-containing protein [Gemmatimonadaceae bacterium]
MIAPFIRRTAARAAVLAALAAVAAPVAVAAQSAVAESLPMVSAASRLPFKSGELLEYEVKFGFVPVGSGSMEVAGMEDVRGKPSMHVVFKVRGGTFVYRVNDRMESWFDPATFESRRFWQDIAEGSYKRRRRFEIFSDRQRFQQDEKEEEASVENPLDDASFLYFVRTIPLEVGKTYEFARYFQPDANPVRIKVLRKERVDVPAGKFDAVVIQPFIKSKGVFNEKSEALIWLSDDSTRTMLQMKSKLVIGSLSLHLKKVRRGTSVADSSQ